MSLTWTQNTSVSNYFYSIASSSNGNVLIVGTVFGGPVYVSTNSGITWNTTSLPNGDWYGLASSSDGTKLVATSFGGRIYTSTDSGTTWTARESNRNWVSVASSADGIKLVAAVRNGNMYTSTDSGVTWTPRGNNINWVSVASSADGTKLFASSVGPLYTSTDSGVTWTSRFSSQNYGAVASSADGTKLVVVVKGWSIYRSTNSGVNWTEINLRKQWSSISSSSDGTNLIAAEDGGKIYISSDSGTTWAQTAQNKYWKAVTSSSDGNKLAAVAYQEYIYTTSKLPQTASAAITSGTSALTTYMGASTATSVALATEVRTAIKALTDATVKAASKAAYIAAMRTKEPTLKVAVPQTDFSTYITTFSNVPTAISAAPKPIDVILPSASNIVDITTASVDETKYTALEMPINTTVTVQDNGTTVGTLTYNGSAYTDGNGNTYNVGDTIIFGTKKVTILGEGSALVSITNTYKSIEINLNVEISANGELNVLGYSPTAPSNIVIATNTLPVDALYDSASGVGLFEFWEPDNLNDIEAQLASTQTLGGVQGYKITAKKLALGLQNVLIGELDAKSAEPFSTAPKYGAANTQNGNRVMTGFGRLALMAYAHYLMGHVQATAAITNDTDFMKGMLSLNSDTLTDYKYANIGNYNASAAPWSTSGTPTDANLAARLVKALLDANTSSSLVSNGAANSVANIVNQVIGQDASRATDEDNNKYSPENHGLLRFYPDDIIYVSINLTTPVVNVGTGQLVSDETLQDLYTNATGDKKYTLKITLGPASA
jgi:hypothetical protein